MAGIRVISGKAKGRKLQMVPGNGSRPIPDRVKQALFNIIGADIIGATFLDLFAGTGSVGIEALSRGAASCLFLEIDRRAIQTVRSNVSLCKLEDNAEIVQRDAFAFLKGSGKRAFDYIFVAPPQYQGLWEKALRKIDQNASWLNPDGVVVVQIDPGEYSPLDLVNLLKYDERKYGNTLLLFFERPGE